MVRWQKAGTDIGGAIGGRPAGARPSLSPPLPAPAPTDSHRSAAWPRGKMPREAGPKAMARQAVRKSCENCARRQVKCVSGQLLPFGERQPCERCAQQRVRCVYLEFKKPGPKAAGADNTSHSARPATTVSRAKIRNREAKHAAAASSVSGTGPTSPHSAQYSGASITGSSELDVFFAMSVSARTSAASASGSDDMHSSFYTPPSGPSGSFDFGGASPSNMLLMGDAMAGHIAAYAGHAQGSPPGYGSGAVPLQAAFARIDSPLHMLPSSLTFPSQEIAGALVQSFWAHRAPIYNFIHPLTFANQIGRNSMVVASICLAAFPWCNEPHIVRNSVALQGRFLGHAITAIQAVLDTYLPSGYVTRDEMDKELALDVDEKLDHLCETVFAICMLSSWAAYRGLATLHAQLTDVVVRLAFAIGLHRDPPSSEQRTYGCPDRVTMYLRKVQRRTLWFVVSFSVLFSSHWTRRDISEAVIHYGEDRLFPLNEITSFRSESLKPDFDPSVYYPENHPDPDLKRCLRHDDLLSFAHFPAGSPERAMRLRVTAKILANEERYNWSTNLIYWKLRIKINRYIRDCLDAGTTPADVAAMDMSLATTKVIELGQRAKNLDSTIVDLLDNLSPPMKEAESSGNYNTLIEHFRLSDPMLDESGAAAHAKTQYLIAVRLLRLEILSNFGLHTFDEIANGVLDSGFTSPRFWECLREATVYTRHIQNLLDHNPVVRHLNVGTGPTSTKVGALNVAVLAYLLRDTANSGGVGHLLLDLKRDIQTARDLLAAFARGRPAQSISWVSSVATVFNKLVGALAQTPHYRAHFGNDSEVASQGSFEGLTLVEIETAHLQRDVVRTPQEESNDDDENEIVK